MRSHDVIHPNQPPGRLLFSPPCLQCLSAIRMSKVLRVPKLDLAAVLAQQKQTIDLHLDAYEASTRNLLAAALNYTQHGVAET